MPSLIGKEIGKYRITERIGRGGMADVYLGVHTHLDRQVAIKVLHGHLSEGGDFIERFKREAKAIANLRHPNIVQVFDFDIQDDLILMVMEYIEGVDLQSKITSLAKEGKRLPIGQIGSIINDIAKALDYAHSQGMLHRDVKPANILIDKEGKAFLTDFGIAKIVTDNKLTATGTLIGTPAYMSPEQGKGDDLSEESDIYSLGIVAFEMLTGQVPFDAQTPIGIVHKQITDPIPEISDLVDGVPGPSQEVVNKALAKSPDQRYSTAVDLVVALKRALEAAEFDEETLSAPTLEMQDETAVGEYNQPTIAMDQEEQLDTKQVQEPETSAGAPKSVPEKPEVSVEKPKSKIPLGGVIAAGVVLVGIAAVAITQVVDFGETEIDANDAQSVIETAPSQLTSAPSATPEKLQVDDLPVSTHITDVVRVVFNQFNIDRGLSLTSGGDVDSEIVMVGSRQTWRSGSGQVLPSNDGNATPEYGLAFEIDDVLAYQIPLGSLVRIEVQYTDIGNDSFNIEYDAHVGDPFWNATEGVIKGDSKDILNAIFFIEDAYFGNRYHDFRINDGGDGPETIWEVRVTIYPKKSAQEYASEGQSLFDQGKIEESIQYFDLALTLGNEEVSMFTTYAWAYTQAVSPEQGIEVLDQALEIHPNDPEIRSQRGDIFWFWMGDAENAQNEFDLAIENIGDDFRPYLLRGVFSRDNDLFEQCIQDLDIYLSHDSEDAWGRLSRGDCHNGLKQNEKAKEDYEVFLEVTEGENEYGWNFDDDRNRIQSWLADY